MDQTQRFLENGTRVPVTVIAVSDLPVIAAYSKDKNGYTALQVGIDVRKKASKALLGHVKAAKMQVAPRFLREIRVDAEESLPNVGESVKVADVLKPGQIVDVSGISKGKGFAGVVKRHHFKGGPKTHGQSDRERAPGSIGQTTTPGRVYKGKRMAGRMGSEKVTIKNLEVIDVSDTAVFIKGLVPGVRNSLVTITVKGENKKFVPFFKEPVKEEDVKEEIAMQTKQAAPQEPTTEVQEESKDQTPVVETEKKEAA